MTTPRRNDAAFHGLYHILIVVFCSAFSLFARSPLIRQADSLAALGGIRNLSVAFELLEKASIRSPGDYEIHWRAAKACNAYATALMNADCAGWREKNALLAKKGMALGEKAVAIDCPEGTGRELKIRNEKLKIVEK